MGDTGTDTERKGRGKLNRRSEAELLRKSGKFVMVFNSYGQGYLTD